MQLHELTPLRQALVKSGIAPKYATQMMQELADHHADVCEHAIEAGCSAEEAARLANQRTGQIAEIAEVALATKELLAWSRTAPRAFYIGYPLIVFFGYLAIVIGLIHLAAASGPPAQSTIELLNLAGLYGPAVLGLTFCTALLVKKNQTQAPLVHPLVGTSLLIALGFGFELSATWVTAVADTATLWVAYDFTAGGLGACGGLAVVFVHEQCTHHRNTNQAP